MSGDPLKRVARAVAKVETAQDEAHRVIREAWHSGATVRAIAEAAGLSKSEVGRIIQRDA